MIVFTALTASFNTGVGNLSLVVGQKQTLRRVWQAVLTFYQQFRSFAVGDVVKTWDFMECESD